MPQKTMKRQVCLACGSSDIVRYFTPETFDALRRIGFYCSPYNPTFHCRNCERDFSFIRKQRRCPGCKSGQVVPIGYGLPTDQTWNYLQRGAMPPFYRGGCVIYPDNPTYHCQDCGRNFAPGKRRVRSLGDRSLPRLDPHRKRRNLGRVNSLAELRSLAESNPAYRRVAIEAGRNIVGGGIKKLDEALAWMEYEEKRIGRVTILNRINSLLK